MAATPSVNIVIAQGADFSEVFNSTETDGTASNLSGYTGAASLRKYPESATKKDFSVSITGSTGEVTISMTDEVTATIKHGRHYYDVLLTSSSGLKSRMVEGMAMVTAGITT